MLSKIASALARVLEPIKPIERPGKSISLSKSPDSGEGGYGSPGYEGPEKGPEQPLEKDAPHALSGEEGQEPAEHPERRLATVPFQPGLTQVILDLNSHRIERNAGTAAQTYETGAKDQKKNARLPKGSMLDKKVG